MSIGIEVSNLATTLQLQTPKGSTRDCLVAEEAAETSLYVWGCLEQPWPIDPQLTFFPAPHLGYFFRACPWVIYDYVDDPLHYMLHS